MAAFTHPAPSRFTDGTYGVYYAGDSLKTAIAETVFHRERFLSASNEPACLIQMREYIAKVKEKLVSVSEKSLAHVLHPDISQYPVSQDFGRQLKVAQEWGVYYPSVRATGQYCVAIFRAPALTIPHQAAHLDYIWDGQSICEVRKASVIA